MAWRQGLVALACLGGAGAAMAQTDPALMEPLRAHFADLRRAAVQADPTLSRPPRWDPQESFVTLTDCLDSGRQLGVEYDDPERLAINIAMGIEQSQSALKQLRIDAAVWQPVLAQMEAIALQSLVDIKTAPKRARQKQEAYSSRLVQLQEELGRRATAARRRAAPRAAEVVWTEGCGAGELAVQIRTSPPGGRVSYITLFHHRLCQAKGQDADNPLQCRGWVEAVKSEEFLSGRYAYQVRWPDGSTRRGIFDASSAPPVSQDSDTVRVTLTR